MIHEPDQRATSVKKDGPAANPALLLRKHYAFQQGCFVSEQQGSMGGVFAFSQVTPIPMWNHIAWIDGKENELLEFIKQGSEWQSEKSRRPVIYIPEPTNDQLSILKAAGFERFDQEAWMTCEFDTENRPTEAVVKVQDRTSFQEFVETFKRSFQIKESGYRKVLDQGSAGRIQTQHFVLHDDGSNPVSVGTLCTDGEVACIYNLGTPPEERGKGYGGRIFGHIAFVARELGCSTIFLQVENNSAAQRLYEKHGFRTSFIRVGFRSATWQPKEANRTRLGQLLGFRTANGNARHLREGRLLPEVVAKKSRPELYLAAWAYLLHRYAGDEVPEFTTLDPVTKEQTAIGIKVDRDSVIEKWLETLPKGRAVGEERAAESFLQWRRNETGIRDENQFPLEVHIFEQTNQIEITFRSDLFSKDAIRRMATHFATILEFLAIRPQAQVGEIEMLGPDEKRQLLGEWSKSHFEPTSQNIVHLFEAQVEKTPDAIAIVLARLGESHPAAQLTYRQLNRRANRLAHRLQEMGVRREVFVGVCLDRSPDMVVALLAVLKAGGACVPLDPAYPPERLGFMIQDAHATVILTHQHFVSQLNAVHHARIVVLDSQDSPKAGNEKNLAITFDPSSAAYVIYTSGSTGIPKGVVIPHKAIANHSVDCRRVYGLNPRDRVLQFSSFNFDASFEQILPALISGASLVLRDNEVWNTREFADKLRDFQLTVADIPTAYWHQLATEWAAHPEAVPAHALRLVIVGGEALSPEKLALWHRSPMAQVRLINAYGPTETTITATSFEVPPRDETTGDLVVLPIGRPRGDRKVFVLDRFGTPTPIGLPGELYIGGSMLARGYHNRNELTTSRFVPDPFSDESEARLYRTGDLVRFLEDGNLEFLGRMDDQVKIRGFRIELGEIESCLNRHPNVRDAIVVTRPDQTGEIRLVAYVTAPVHPPEARELRQHLKKHLPEYMVPTSFVVLEQWPLMPNGKVDRRALPQPAEELPPQTIKGPESPLELQLKLLFERILKRAPIGVDVSFFELGGDSLQALELLVEIEKSTGRQLPLGTLYQSSTVETLAREVQSCGNPPEWSSLVTLQASGKRPPLILLHTTPGDILGYGNLVYRLGHNQPCYGFQSLGLKDSQLSHTSVQEMATYYLGLLRAFQPRGPYFLGGWCYGGIVSVEMARMLKAQGETIALLALLETVALPARWTNLAYWLNRIACFFKMSPQRWISYFQSKARYARESRIANKMRFRQGNTSLEGDLLDPRLAQLEHVYNTNLAALKNYRSEYYDGKVTLFNAAERDLALIQDPKYGWVGLAREIEVHEVPGDHDTMLTEPNVSALAHRLTDCLLRAQQTSPATGKTNK